MKMNNLTSTKKLIRRISFAVAATMIALTSASCTESEPPKLAKAKDLPACGSKVVRETFTKVSTAIYTDAFPIQLEDLEPDAKADKRWCRAFYLGEICVSGRFQPGPCTETLEAIFTLEWINESSDRFWLQMTQVNSSGKPLHSLAR
jgi:hypothetical protein